MMTHRKYSLLLFFAGVLLISCKTYGQVRFQSGWYTNTSDCGTRPLCKTVISPDLVIIKYFNRDTTELVFCCDTIYTKGGDWYRLNGTKQLLFSESGFKRGDTIMYSDPLELGIGKSRPDEMWIPEKVVSIEGITGYQYRHASYTPKGTIWKSQRIRVFSPIYGLIAEEDLNCGLQTIMPRK